MAGNLRPAAELQSPLLPVAIRVGEAMSTSTNPYPVAAMPVDGGRHGLTIALPAAASFTRVPASVTATQRTNNSFKYADADHIKFHH